MDEPDSNTVADTSDDGAWSVKSVASVAGSIAFYWQLVGHLGNLSSCAALTAKQRLYQWWKAPSRKQLLLDNLANAQVFEEWLGAAYLLDDLEENNLWYERAHGYLGLEY